MTQSRCTAARAPILKSQTLPHHQPPFHAGTALTYRSPLPIIYQFLHCQKKRCALPLRSPTIKYIFLPHVPSLLLLVPHSLYLSIDIVLPTLPPTIRSPDGPLQFSQGQPPFPNRWRGILFHTAAVDFSAISDLIIRPSTT